MNKTIFMWIYISVRRRLLSIPRIRICPASSITFYQSCDPRKWMDRWMPNKCCCRRLFNNSIAVISVQVESTLEKIPDSL